MGPLDRREHPRGASHHDFDVLIEDRVTRMAEIEVHQPPFTWGFVLSILENRLEMWVGRATYERAVALVIGFDLAQPVSIEQPLQARVASRYDTVTLRWPWMLMAEAVGGDVGSPADLGDLTPEQDAKAIALLVSELRAVLDSPSSSS